jgi:hypothetical protein
VGIWEQRDDLYSLDYAPHAGSDGSGLIALGHHSRGLTALDARGQLLWRLGPQDSGCAIHEYHTNERTTPSAESPSESNTEMRGRTWHAAISADGRTIYAASLGAAEDGGWLRARRTPGWNHQVVAIDAAIGKPVKTFRMGGRVTLLATLPAPLAVAAVHDGRAGAEACCSLTALDAGLRKEAWSLRCPPDVIVTALASAPGAAVLIAGTNRGELWRVGAFTGRILARYDLLYASAVLSVAVAQTGEIAAGLANGQVAFLEQVRDEQQRAQR